MQSTTPGSEGRPRARRFADYLAVLARWRTPIFSATLLGGILGAAYYWFLVPNIYESKTVIKSSLVTTVNASGLGSMLGSRGLGDIGGLLGIGGQRGDLEQHVGVLLSRAVIGSVVREYGLQADMHVKTFEEAVKAFRDALTVATDRETQQLTITVPDTSAARAQRICTSLIAALDSVNKALAHTNALHSREYLEVRFTQCKNDLAAAEDSLRVFQIRYRVFDMKEQAAASIKVAASLEGEIAVKEAQANILSRTLGADDADTRRLYEEAEELKRQRRQLDTGMDIQSALQTIVPFAQAPQIGMEYFRRYREAEIQQKLFALLYPLYEQAKVDEQRNTPTVIVLDPPSLAERKSKPKRTLATLAIMFAVFVCAYVYALLRDSWLRFRADDPAGFDSVRRSIGTILFRRG